MFFNGVGTIIDVSKTLSFSYRLATIAPSSIGGKPRNSKAGSDRVVFYTVIGACVYQRHRHGNRVISLIPSMPFIKRKHESRITGNVYAAPEVVNNAAWFSRILG